MSSDDSSGSSSHPPPPDPLDSPTSGFADRTSHDVGPVSSAKSDAFSIDESPTDKPGASVAPTIDADALARERHARSLDHLAELLQGLMSPSPREGSMGRIENYDVMSIVGQGAMGIVLRAIDNALKRVVAIKLMAPHLLSSGHAKERFQREARSAAVVSHPNVVTIHAVSEVKGVPYLVMEFIEGQSLEQRIRARAIETPDVLRISQQMAAGLAAAHKQGIIHRDIKPSNVLLEDNIERVRIADFGLARVIEDKSELTSDGQIVGTPAYMSPEQVNGEKLDPRSDLFSVGCVMYAMLAGHSPFQAQNGLAASRAVMNREPEPLTAVGDRVPPFLCELIHRLLQKDPAARFQSADELERELTRHIRSWDSLSNTPTVPLKALPQQRRNSNLMTALVAVTGIAAGIAAWPYVSEPIWLTPNAAGPGKDADRTGTMGPATGTSISDRRITVSKQGTAQFVRLSDAIDAAQPGSVIEILDQGPYSAALQLNDSQRLRGLTIRGHDTVVSHPGLEPIIQISSVPDVSITGLVVNVTGHQHGLEILGNCPDLLVEKCRFQSIVAETSSPDSSRYAISLIYLHEGASGLLERPVTLRELQLRYGAVGIVLGDPSGTGNLHDVRITECVMIGPGGSYGYPLIVQEGCQNVSITRNLLEDAEAAISFALPAANTDVIRGLEFSGNTIHHVASALFLNDSPLSQRIIIRNNLFLDVPYLPVDADRVGQITPWFSGNVWEHAIDDQQLLIERVAERRDEIAVESRLRSSDKYLVPKDIYIQAGRDRWQPQ